MTKKFAYLNKFYYLCTRNKNYRMRNTFPHLLLVSVLLTLLNGSISAAENYSLRFYDDTDGLSHWHMSQTIQDSTGMMWIGTWNGLNRFDGSRFVCFKPGSADAVCMPNDRIRRLQLTPDNNILCVFTDHVFLFDTRACRFDTLPAAEEAELYEHLQQPFNPDYIRPREQFKQFGEGLNMRNVWSDYTDRQGNLWLINDHGLYVATPLPSRGTRINNDEVRCLHRMRNGEIWASVRDSKQIQVYDSCLHLRGYLDRHGVVHPHPVDFGDRVYCIYETADERVLIGCKPGKMISLQGDEYEDLRNVYDILEDKDGHLWVATFGYGLWKDYVLIPGTENMSVRRLLMTDEGLMLAATTSGILVVDGDEVRLHQREAKQDHSISSNAIMCLCLFNGKLYAGTEGGGLNILKSDIHADNWEWDHIMARDGLESDIIFELMPWSTDELLLQGSNSLALLNTRTNSLTNYGRSFFGHKRGDSKLVLGEVPPVALNDSQLLVTPTRGMFILNKSELKPDNEPVRIAMSSIRRNGKEDYAVDQVDRIVLAPEERNIVMTFAALDYRNNGELLYRTRLYKEGEKNGVWNAPTETNEVIIQDMLPGNYIFEICSTNAYGHWQDNTRRIHITVQPTFFESTFGKGLLIGILLLITLVITATALQLRYSRKKRAETLDAYLELQERLTEMEQQSPANEPLPVPEILAPGYTSENEKFLNALHQFLEKNIDNSDLSMDDLALETNMSRSTLNRKMHELFNLSAKDFVQAARIKHACHLLRTTDMAIKEIAYACGFSDPRYFSKCFKANTSQMPTEYRTSSSKEP